MGAGKSEICRTGRQAGSSGSPEAGFLLTETAGFTLRPFK